jgi:hypothetical protein
VYNFRDRALRPILGVIDPDHTLHCGPELTAFSGLDVLCHALESFTAVPYHNRGKRPETPMMRPAYQVSIDFFGCSSIVVLIFFVFVVVSSVGM